MPPLGPVENGGLELALVIAVCGGAVYVRDLAGERVQVSCEKRILDSLIGANCVISKAEGHKPEGIRLVVEENSNIKI